ncbi:MAG: caspase family protein [Brumimicrobium sp.]|nr:caspase family protein [Brumimicrobium sp.]
MRIRLVIISLFLSLIGFSQEAELVTQQNIRGVITDFVFSPEGDYIANISEGDASIHVWHLPSEKIIGSLQDYEKEVVRFAYSDSGNEIISLHSDDLVVVWDLNKWTIQDSLRLDYTPDFVEIASGQVFIGKAGKISIYSVDFKEKGAVDVKGKPQGSFSDSHHLWVGTDAGELIKIDLTSLEVNSRQTYANTDFTQLDLSESKDRLCSVNKNGSLSIISVNSLSLLKNISPVSGGLFKSVYAKANAESGIVAYISEKNQIDCYNFEGNLSFQLIDTVEAEEIKVLAFSPNGNVLCSSSFKSNILSGTLSSRNSIKVWDLNRKGLMGELEGSVNPVTQFSFHPLQNLVALLGEGRSLSLWNMDYAEKSLEFELMEPKREQKIALVSEQEKENLKENTLFGTKTINLRKLADKVTENTVHKTVSKVISEPVLVKFSSKGNYLITKLEDDEVRIYSFDGKGFKYLHYAEHQQERINEFMTDPNEEYLICLGAGEEAVSVINLKTGKLVRKLKTENPNNQREILNNAVSGAYNPNGRNFAVCTGKGQIFVWSSSFYEVHKTEGMNIFRAGKNASVSYSPDGTKLYLKGIDGIRAYDLTDFHPLLTTKLKMPGRPYSLNTPHDFMVGFDENTGYIEHLNSHELISFPTNRALINAVDASPRGYIGIGLKNGEFRLIDTKTGQLLATFVGEKENTIIKTNDNFYKVNKDGFELVSFRIGRKAYPFEQFDAYYNRPDLVLKSLKCPDEEYVELYKNAHDRRLKKLNISSDETPDFKALPKLTIANRANIPFSQSESVLKLKLNAESQKHPLSKIRITINNVPVEMKTVSGTKTEQEINLELIAGLNKINVYVIDAGRQESLAESVTVNCSRNDKPDLYLITIGTSKYKDARFNLNYAAKDAIDLNKLFTSYNQGNFAEINSLTLTNEEVRKESFGKLKEFLALAKRNDQVIFYIAGHGVLDADYDYYYGTHDIDFLTPGNRGLSYDKLEEILSGIAPVKKLLLMDTCHSGEVEADEVSTVTGNEEDVAFEDVTFRAVGPKLREGTETRASAGKMARLLFADIRKGTGATVISSAGGVEFAMEGDDWKNGLFTYCLLNGMKNKTADLNNDGTIMLSELQRYLFDKVGNLSHGKQVPTTRVQNIRLDYPVW